MKKKLVIIVSVLLALVLAVSLVGCIPQSERGATGSQGEQGIQGVPGLPGPKGDTGPQGEQGLKGEHGEQGERGKRGYEGEEGERGLRGPKGATGAIGAKGDKGDTGDTGATGPAFPNLGILLYVEDGTQEIAHVTYVLDEPIALEDLTELMFFQELVYGTGNFGANVILGIDVDGDGYEANDLAWHIGSTQHTLAVLGDDTFIEMDGASFSSIKVDAMSISQWWTPDESGAGFAKSDSYPWTFYGSFSDLINVFLQDSTQTSLIPDASAKVCLIRLVIGGSGSWMDIAIRVTSDMIPTEVGVYSQ